jgi:hypothetical protein
LFDSPDVGYVCPRFSISVLISSGLME